MGAWLSPITSCGLAGCPARWPQCWSRPRPWPAPDSCTRTPASISPHLHTPSTWLPPLCPLSLPSDPEGFSRSSGSFQGCPRPHSEYTMELRLQDSSLSHNITLPPGSEQLRDPPGRGSQNALAPPPAGPREELCFSGVASGFNTHPAPPNAPKCPLCAVGHLQCRSRNPASLQAGTALRGPRPPWAPRTWLHRWAPALPQSGMTPLIIGAA